MEYIKKTINTKDLKLKESCIRLYPLVCFHIGAKQSDMVFIEQHIKRIKNDPNGYWIYMGDGGECVTKSSKGNIYEQLLSPQEQADSLVSILNPIRHKGILGIRGNHGNRIDKESGLSFDKYVCTALGIPYQGVSTFFNLVVNRSYYDLFLHHGTDSGSPLTTKINAAEKFNRFIEADAILTAHSHVAMELPPNHVMSCDNTACSVKTRLQYQYICGCAYDSRSGYAEEKGYPPLLPAHLVIEFDGRIIEGCAQKSIKCEIIRSDGQHEIHAERARDYLGG